MATSLSEPQNVFSTIVKRLKEAVTHVSCPFTLETLLKQNTGANVDADERGKIVVVPRLMRETQWSMFRRRRAHSGRQDRGHK